MNLLYDTYRVVLAEIYQLEYGRSAKDICYLDLISTLNALPKQTLIIREVLHFASKLRNNWAHDKDLPLELVIGSTVMLRGWLYSLLPKNSLGDVGLHPLILLLDVWLLGNRLRIPYNDGSSDGNVQEIVESQHDENDYRLDNQAIANQEDVDSTNYYPEIREPHVDNNENKQHYEIEEQQFELPRYQFIKEGKLEDIKKDPVWLEKLKHRKIVILDGDRYKGKIATFISWSGTVASVKFDTDPNLRVNISKKRTIGVLRI